MVGSVSPGNKLPYDSHVDTAFEYIQEIIGYACLGSDNNKLVVHSAPRLQASREVKGK